MQQVMRRILAGSMLIGASVVTNEAAGAQGSYKASGSYANPDGNTTEVWKKRGPCGDPYISIALIAVFGAADRAKCDAAQYNGGRWNNYNDLVHAVWRRWQAALPTLDVGTVSFKMVSDTVAKIAAANGTPVGEMKNGKLEVDPATTQRLVAAGGGNIVSKEGNSLVAAGGGNLVGPDGGTLVAAGGGNLAAAIDAKMATATVTPASGPSGYKVMSVTSYSALKAATRKR